MEAEEELGEYVRVRTHPGQVVLGFLVVGGGAVRAWLATSFEGMTLWLFVASLGLVVLEVSRHRGGLTERRSVRVSVDQHDLQIGGLRVPRSELVDVTDEEAGLLLVRRGLRPSILLDADDDARTRLRAALSNGDRDRGRLALSPVFDRGWIWLVALASTLALPVVAALSLDPLDWLDVPSRVLAILAPLLLTLALAAIPCRVRLDAHALRRTWVFGETVWRLGEIQQVKERSVLLGDGRSLPGLSFVHRGRRHQVFVFERGWFSTTCARELLERLQVASAAARASVERDVDP